MTNIGKFKEMKITKQDLAETLKDLNRYRSTAFSPTLNTHTHVCDNSCKKVSSLTSSLTTSMLANKQNGRSSTSSSEVYPSDFDHFSDTSFNEKLSSRWIWCKKMNRLIYKPSLNTSKSTIKEIEFPEYNLEYLKLKNKDSKTNKNSKTINDHKKPSECNKKQEKLDQIIKEAEYYSNGSDKVDILYDNDIGYYLGRVSRRENGVKYEIFVNVPSISEDL